MMAARGTFGSDGFHMYRVVVSTGQAAGAGTDSRIFLTMIGAAGQSSEMQLKDSLTGSDSFERGSTDEFALRIKADIGDILRIVLRSDASALGSDWLVSRVVISNCENRNQYTFDCADFWIRDSLPHEFICSHRIKREVQLESVADSSGLLLSARLPIPGKPPPPPPPPKPFSHPPVFMRMPGAKDELLEESECAAHRVIAAPPMLIRRV